MNEIIENEENKENGNTQEVQSNSSNETKNESAAKWTTKAKDKIVSEWNSYTDNTRTLLKIVMVLLVGLFISSIQIFGYGLGYTNLDPIRAWGAWVIADFGLIVVGAGAFFTGFIFYIFRRDELQPIINAAVLVGFLCYLFTPIFIIYDLGQPLRMWFGFVYPNWTEHIMPNSMMTEVMFCVTFYLMILIIEFTPIVLKHKVLDKIPVLHYIGHYMHKLMWIAAAVGTFLSVFHQGSLGGGLYGELYAKAAWFRPHHQLFYMAIISAMAVGPSFTLLVTWLTGKVLKKEMVPAKTFIALARVSGFMFFIYFIFRIFDLYTMINIYVPSFDRNFFDLWGGAYGLWLLVLELVLCLIPVIFLNMRKYLENETTRVIGVSSAVLGMVLQRSLMTLHGVSVPNFPWESFLNYWPSIQEWISTLGILSIMLLMYMWCVRYLPIFPYADEHAHSHNEA